MKQAALGIRARALGVRSFTALRTTSRPLLMLAGAVAVFAALLIPALSSDNIRPAFAAAAPDVFLYRAYAQRNIVSTGDIVLTARYQLPTYTGAIPVAAEEWCAQLVDTAGCTTDPVEPEAPTSLANGLAFVRLRSVSTGANRGEQQIKRIGHGIIFLYIGVGHGLTWGDTDLELCIESGASDKSGNPFSPTSESCTAGIDWSPEDSDTSEQRDDWGQAILSIMRELEQENSVAYGTYVTNNSKVTVLGQVFTREQIIPAEKLVPTVFATGASALVSSAYATPLATERALTQRLAATATASTTGQAIEGASTEFVGLRGNTSAAFIMVLIGFVAAGAAGGASRNAFVGGVAFFAGPIIGVFLNAPPVHVLIAVLFVLSIPLALLIAGKLRI